MQLKMYNHFLETGKHEAGTTGCFKNHYNTLHQHNSRVINLVLNSFMPIHKYWIFLLLLCFNHILSRYSLFVHKSLTSFMSYSAHIMSIHLAWICGRITM
jgi:hypothetical protein